MKLEIDIDEDYYKIIRKRVQDNKPYHSPYEYEVIADGKPLEQEPTYCPKFRDQQEKHRVFHTITVVDKFFSAIGNDDVIDDISVLKELVRKMEVEE